MDSTQNFWNRNADKYAKSKIGDLAAYEYTLERSRSYMKASDHVLEFGCGTGMTAMKLAPSVAHFTGTDISARMVEHCKERLKQSELQNVTFQRAAVGDDCFKGQQFDIVMAHSLLHLLPDLEQGLMQIRDLVKPGGLFISKTVCITERGGLKVGAIKLAIPIMRLFGLAPFVNYFNIAELEGALGWAGFKIIESGNFPNKAMPSRYLVARRD